MRTHARLAVVSLLFSLPLFAQSIFTVAGGGSEDGQNASSIFIYGPSGLAFDSAGNLLFAEAGAGRVRRIDAKTSVVSTLAGNGASGFSGDGGAAINATLKNPRGIALDGNQLYVADLDNNRIRRIDLSTGIISTFAGGGTPQPGEIGEEVEATAAELFRPSGLVISRGHLYFTEDAFNGNRVRRVNLTTRIIQTVAGPKDGSSGFAGDGGPAISAKLNSPVAITADPAGNLFVADTGNNRVRRIDAATGNINTYVQIELPIGVALDSAGNLFVTNVEGRLHRVDRTTQAIERLETSALYLPFGIAVDRNDVLHYAGDIGVIYKRTPAGVESVAAGGGSYVGDGLVATAAILHAPRGVAFTSNGDLLIADSINNSLRRVSASDGTISTVAGQVGRFYAGDQEGISARDAIIGAPMDVAVDSANNIYVADPHNNRVWRIDANNRITTYAGGGGALNDGGPATQAEIIPIAIAFDAQNNLFIADRERVRRVDAQTRTISTFAGTGEAGFSGDGGPARAAQLSTPSGIAFDRDGNVYIADSLNGRVRRVAPDGTISTFAGRAEGGVDLGDGGPALQAALTPIRVVVDRAGTTLYVVDAGSHRVRRIDLRSSTITTLAGSATVYFETDFAGDNGPATAAKLNFGYERSGIALDSAGNVYFSDTVNNRVRAVFACVDVSAPQLQSPANSATGVSTAPTLRWTESTGAFRYDVLLDTVSPPTKQIASDVSETSFTPSNLQPATRYFWQIVANGDPFCAPVRTAASTVQSFTTSGRCEAGPFQQLAPADGATQLNAPIQLTWSASAGAVGYDLYLGQTNPPPLAVTNLRETSFTIAGPSGGTYFWRVVAHAACDEAQTASTPIRSFTPNVLAPCEPPTVQITSPANNSINVGTDVTLAWNGVGGTSFDVYFGTSSTPPLLVSGLSDLSQRVENLDTGTRYFWRVVARVACDATKQTSTPIVSFVTRADCATPGETTITFAPTTITSGATYAIVWSPAVGLDSDGGYLVERSTTPSFASILDSQVAASTAASFVAGTPDTYYHRVRAVSACDPTKLGPPSPAKAVTVVAARPNVIFTTQPQAVITTLGERLEDRRGSFTLENVGSESLQVILGRQELSGSAPFFTIIDPQGRDAAFVTLQPRQTRTFEIRYSGPPNNVAAAYQGVIFVASTGQGLSVTPYAFVSLKVGGGAAAAPELIVDGAVAEYAAFPGFNGDDSTRAPLTIGVRNPGSSPMEVAAEIGPEVWLVPEANWNATPIPAGATREVKLFSQRNRAPNGSALPRYTYFTIRTKDGATKRLLVQDNELAATGTGRTSALSVRDRSFIVPEAVSRSTAAGQLLATRMRLSNIGSDAVQVELVFTPAGVDGFDATAVRRAVVLVPANDVVTLTDPLVQLFSLTRPTRGQLEVRIPRERLGLIAVTSTETIAGRVAGFTIPTLNRGEGARVGSPHHLLGVTASANRPGSLVLAETSGADSATVLATLVNNEGQQLEQTTHVLGRYGYKRVDGFANAPAGSRINLSVESGGGAVAGLFFIDTDSGAVSVSRASTDSAASTALARAFYKGAAATPFSITTVVPIVPTPTSSGASANYQTSLALVATTGSPATFTAVFRDASGGAPVTRSVTVAASSTRTYDNVVAELFGLPATTQGSVFVEAPSSGRVYAMLQSSSASSPSFSPSGFLPLPTTLSDALSSASGSARRPLFLDGLDQSTDPTRGSRWLVLLNEVAGATGFVNVRLYEAGNRSRPIAERDLFINAYQQLKLDTVFGELGLDSAERRKDRTNVQLVVTALSGGARVAASAMSIDNVTGDTKVQPLAPSVGSATFRVNLVVPIVPQTLTPARRRVGPR